MPRRASAVLVPVAAAPRRKRTSQSVRCRWERWAFGLAGVLYVSALVHAAASGRFSLSMSSVTWPPPPLLPRAMMAATSHKKRSLPTPQQAAPRIAKLQSADMHRRSSPENTTRPVYALVSFQDLKQLGDGLRLLISSDGLQWSALAGSPLLLPLARIKGAKVFRDPSVVWHAGYFHLVFTSDLCVDQVPVSNKPLTHAYDIPWPVRYLAALPSDNSGVRG